MNIEKDDSIRMDPARRWLFTLYLGLDRPMDEALRQELDLLIAPVSASFTLLSGLGCFADSREHTHLIQIAVEDKSKAYACAESLRAHFCQKAVGVVCNGLYERVLER